MDKLKTLECGELLGKLSAESIGKMLNWVHLTDLRNKVVQQDREGIALWVNMLPAGGYITIAERDAVLLALAETEEIPAVPASNWSATVIESTKKDTMIFPVVEFKNSVTGEIVKRTFNGDDVTQERLKELAVRVIAQLDARDTSADTIAIGKL